MSRFMPRSWRSHGAFHGAFHGATHGAVMAQNSPKNGCEGPGCGLRHDLPLKGEVMASGNRIQTQAVAGFMAQLMAQSWRKTHGAISRKESVS